MDIAALSMHMSASNVGVQVGIALQKMGQNMMEENGVQVTSMIKNMECSVTPHLGGSIDLSI